MERTFGIMQIGFFVPMLITEEDYFFYKDKKYSWNAIVTIKRSDGFMSFLMRYPSTSILINDGTIVIIPAILQEKFLRRDNKYGYRDQYEELIQIIENKNTQNIRMFNKYLCSDNYIMFYRWVIAGTLVLLIFDNLFKVGDKDRNNIIFCLVFGICMLLKRHIDKYIVFKKMHKSDKIAGSAVKNAFFN